MSKQRNILRIGLFMIFCELLLGVFICRWIWSQFEQEKTSLQKNILLQFTEAKQEALDSVILKNIVAPALHNKISSQIKRGQTKKGNIFIDTIIDSNSNETGNVIKLSEHLRDVLPTYIKMDIEGAELDALTGAEEIIKKC
ncbi:MAG: FkbM family methyltransferase, partial [Bacteroidia bacterium]